MTDEMAWIPAQKALVGSDTHYPEEGPVHEVTTDGFWIQTHQVTNAGFGEFVDATGYVTVAERPLNPECYPGAPAENLKPGSMVFHRTPGPVDLRHLDLWWTWTPGACWSHPRGPRSSLRGHEQHPVVHIAFEDAQAYADWAGRELPTESEWEVAARGGLQDCDVHLGRRAPRSPGSGWRTTGTASSRSSPRRATEPLPPSAAFAPNGYGLFDMAGNVWEWTVDWYTGTRAAGACCAADSYDPAQPQFPIPRKVVKGGSFLCADNYCLRYRPAARRPQPVDTGMSHIGFRCIKR